tara:strand:+ start:49 stop:1158 length:1110 start_codon:yes stop_codon:yes gene_type:complete
MKSKSPFKLFSLSAREADQRGNYANPRLGRYRPTTFENPDLSGIKSSKAEPREKVKSVNSVTPDRAQVKGRGLSEGFDLSSKTIITNKEIPGAGKVSLEQAYENRNMDEYGDMTPTEFNKVAKADPLYGTSGSKGSTQRNKTTNIFADGKLIKTYDNPIGQMKGSPNKLIGDTMNINPGAVPPNQAQNDLGAQPIISADGSQPNARAIDIAAIANPYATPGADFNPQSKMKAESIFGSPMQRQGLMNLGTPLHHDSEKQAHSHPSKTTTKMKPDGEYPGARYVKGDLVDQDDLLEKTELDAHIATQVQSDKKGTFIKEKSDDGPGSDIETSKGFGKKIRLGSMGRSSYTSNMKDQLDPHDFLFKKTPKK